MEAFLVPFIPPVALALIIWGVITWMSFSATSRASRRTAAAVSAFLSICGSLAFLAFTGIDDYDDYPGYTCSLRDGYVPEGFPADHLTSPHPDRVSRFHPDLAWSHEYELLPAGVRCTYWTSDDPRVTVVTHSPWSYSVWIYGLLVVAAAQAARTANPDLLLRHAR